MTEQTATTVAVPAADRGVATEVWETLEGVMDPELPVVSVVEMGMIGDVSVVGGVVEVVVVPTFTGCPADDVIKEDVEAAAARVPGVRKAVAKVSFDPPWTTERISDSGKRKLREFGVAPPAGEGPVLISEIGLPKVAACPFCSSTNTSNENAFGPTPCRALYYCNDCRNPFEQFKPV